MATILDLRPISSSEKSPFKGKKAWILESMKMVTVIAIVCAVVYGVSRADFLPKSFSAIGIVQNISPTTLTLVNAKDKAGVASYTLDVSGVSKIETSSYVTLTLSDIHDGDRVIVQGSQDGGPITIHRIVSFTSATTDASSTKQVPVIPVSAVATSTATTTMPIISAGSNNATTTDSTSTPVIFINASSTTATTIDSTSTTANPVSTDASSTDATSTPVVPPVTTTSTTTTNINTDLAPTTSPVITAPAAPSSETATASSTQ